MTSLLKIPLYFQLHIIPSSKQGSKQRLNPPYITHLCIPHTSTSHNIYYLHTSHMYNIQYTLHVHTHHMYMHHTHIHNPHIYIHTLHLSHTSTQNTCICYINPPCIHIQPTYMHTPHAQNTHTYIHYTIYTIYNIHIYITHKYTHNAQYTHMQETHIYTNIPT